MEDYGMQPSNYELQMPTIPEMSGGTDAGAQVASGLQGAVSGAATGSSFGPWGSAIGAVVGGLVSWYGTSQQQSQADKANKQNLALYEQEFGEKTREYNQSEKDTKEQNAKTFAWKDQEESYDRNQTMANRLLGMVNSQPQLQTAIAQKYQQKPQGSAYNFRGLNPIA